MGQVEQIESQVASLAPPELEIFRAWFAEFDAAQWDSQVEKDIAGGTLDDLAKEALSRFQSGNCRKL